MKKIFIVNVRKDASGFLPMEECFLATCLVEMGVNEVEVRSVFPEEIQACADEYGSIGKGDAIVLLWENAFYKSVQTLLEYFDLAKAIRDQSYIFLIAGGYWASTLPQYYPEQFSSFDMIMDGFSIPKVAEVLHKIAKGEILASRLDVRGEVDFNAWKLELKWCSTLEKYKCNSYLSGYRTTFGCPFNCYFCYNNTLQTMESRYSERSLDLICGDLEEIKNYYGNIPIQLKDRNFFFNKERAFQIMKLLSDYGFPVESNIDVTVKDASEDVFANCAQYGIGNMFFGLESFHASSLKCFNKVYPIEKLEQIFALADKYEIALSGCILLGLPWQSTESICEDVERAFSYMKNYKMLRININSYSPLPETTLQRKYFPDVFSKFSLEELYDIYNFRMDQDLQFRLYGSVFKDFNFEKLRAHALSMNSISILEHYHIPKVLHPLIAPIKELLHDNVMHSSEDNAINRYLTPKRITETRRSITRICIELKQIFGSFQS